MKAIARAVDEALDEWYAKGYNDGLEAACRTDNRTLCKCVSEDRENQVKQEGYDAGLLNGKEVVLQKAQNAIDRIIKSPANGGLLADELRKIFGTGTPYSIFIDYTLRDLIEKFDEYDKQIHVGDEIEVQNEGLAGVVTRISSELDFVFGIGADGSVFLANKERVKKTGNHFPEVGKLLEALRGEE